MADLNPEQLEALEKLLEGFDRLTRQARTVGDVIEDNLNKKFKASIDKAAKTAEELAKFDTYRLLKNKKGMSDEQKDAAIEIAGKRASRRVQSEYNEKISQGRQTLTSLGDTAAKLTKRLYSGEQGAKVFAEAMDEAATAIGALTFLLGGPLVKALTVLTLGFFKLTKAASEQSDALFKSFQNLQQSGANAADGLAGVFTMMQNFSYGIDDLDKMTSMIAENSRSLAMFRGSVSDGARALSGIGKEVKISGLRREFMNMGMTIPEINESIAGYIDLQSRLGTTQQRDVKSITASVAAYVKETDAITRLTGATRKQQEDAQKKALNIEQFRYKYQKLMASNDPELIAQGTKMMQTFKMLNALGPGGEQLAEAYASMQTGIVREGAALTGTLISNGQAMQIVNDRNLSAAGTVEALAQVVGNVVDPTKSGSLGELARVGIFKDITGADYGPLLDAIKAAANLEKRLEGVTDEQERLKIIQEAGVKAQVGMRIAQMDARDNMQSFVNLGVAPATTALEGLARAAKNVTKLLPGGQGLDRSEVSPGTGTPGGSRLGGAAARKRGEVPGGAPGDAAAQKRGEVPGGAPGSAPRAAGPVDTTGLRLKSAEAISGGKSDAKLIGLAREIQKQLGGDLVYFSALNDSYHSGGNSKHAQGMALDFTIRDSKYSAGTANLVRDILSASGLKGKVLDEYLNPSKSATGGHIHVELDALAGGGITKGPSIAGEAGPEAVVPLPDGKSIPVELQNLRIGGLGMDGSYSVGPLSTDTKLTDMIMKRLGLSDFSSKQMINASGIGLNYNMAGADIGSRIGGGVLQGEITEQVAKLVESGQPLQEALKSTLAEFNQALQEFIRERSGGTGEGMMELTEQLRQMVELQRNQNRTSERILQVSQN